MTSEFSGGLDAITHYLDDHATVDEIRYFLLTVEASRERWIARADLMAKAQHGAVMVAPQRGEERAH